MRRIGRRTPLVATAVLVLVAMQAPVAWAGPTVRGGADPVVAATIP